MELMESSEFASRHDEHSSGFQEIVKRCQKLQTNLERVDYLYEILDNYHLFDNKYKRDSKNEDKALKIKEQGNKHFAVGRYYKALKCYTKALQFAQSGRLLGICYANRSAVLFKLNLYEECKVDIERALTHDYPEAKKPKLVNRKKAASKRSQFHYKLYEDITSLSPPNRPLIEIKTVDSSNHRVIAKCDIAIGQVISVETAFCGTVNEGQFYHCHHCLSVCYNPIPCNNCTQTLYCNETCTQEASVKYHKDECPILASLIKFNIELNTHLTGCKLALKLSNEETTQFQQLIEIINGANITDIDRANFEMALLTAHVFHLLKKHTEKFNGKEAENAFKEKFPTYLLIAYLHSMEGLELYRFPSNPSHSEFHNIIGRFLFLKHGLLRHSCCPNVFQTLHGNQQVLRAIRTIKKGDECYITRGPNYLKHEKEIREKLTLTAFYTKCSCRACHLNWSSRKTITNRNLLQYFFLGGGHFMHHVDGAKQATRNLIETLKELEKHEPEGDLFFIQWMLEECFNILGNKRIIP